jgi:hypothetical protein
MQDRARVTEAEVLAGTATALSLWNERAMVGAATPSSSFAMAMRN